MSRFITQIVIWPIQLHSHGKKIKRKKERKHGVLHFCSREKNEKKKNERQKETQLGLLPPMLESVFTS